MKKPIITFIILLIIATTIFIMTNNPESKGKKLSFINKDFINKELREVKVKLTKENIIYTKTIEGITQLLYTDTIDDITYIFSYIEINNKYFFLGKSLYNEHDKLKPTNLLLTKASINDFAIYKYSAIEGANYAKTTYLTITNSIPKLLLETDGFTIEENIDDNQDIETICQYGSPGIQTTVYKWDFDNELVSYVNLNESVFNNSPSVYINDKSQIVAYVEGQEKKYTIKNNELYTIPN